MKTKLLIITLLLLSGCDVIRDYYTPDLSGVDSVGVSVYVDSRANRRVSPIAEAKRSSFVFWGGEFEIIPLEGETE